MEDSRVKQVSKVILGTTSKHLLNLFTENFPSVSFTTKCPSLEEKPIASSDTSCPELDPHALTLSVAHAKADVLIDQLLATDESELTVIITVDQVVVSSGNILRKPESTQQCQNFLESYSINPLLTLTAVVVAVIDEMTEESSSSVENHRDVQRFDGVDIATQYFNDIPDTVIKQIAKGDAMLYPGGFNVNDPQLSPYLSHCDGSAESIMGLPVELLRSLLDKAGVVLPLK